MSRKKDALVKWKKGIVKEVMIIWAETNLDYSI